MLANQPTNFNIYNTNGTTPILSHTSAVFCGSNKTNMYQDIISVKTIKADTSLVLQATATTNIRELSNTGEDQLVIFAADDTSKYKGDEFGFVLPETGNTWYAYIQSPHLPSWFVWTPVLTLDSSSIPHNFKAAYSNVGSFNCVNFYVDGKLVWTTLYPDVSGQSYHMALSSHKVSSTGIDISQNVMTIENASLGSNSDNST